MALPNSKSQSVSFELSDFEKMFASAGLAAKEKFGNYDGTPFDEGSSPRLFLVAKKDG